jgi:glucosamine-6-phosphate deaminase
LITKNEVVREKYAEILHFLNNDKQAGDIDTADVLYIKARIRREEARTACRFMGVNPDNVHFLDLPFYETGKVQKGELSDKDILKIIPLLEEVQPHQIFVAGDLADPHGTHKVCLNAALAAIHELKTTLWMKECRIWMYRGAWAEWEIDHIEMAVPISPEQLRKKDILFLSISLKWRVLHFWAMMNDYFGNVPRNAINQRLNCTTN